MNSLKLIIPIVIIFILLGIGAYTIYQAQTTEEIEPTPIADTQQSNFPTATASATPQVQAANPPANQPATGADEILIRNVGIQVSTPSENQKVSNPIKVSGLANVTSQTVVIDLYDTEGNILGSGQASACVGTDACPFEATITVSSPKTQSGLLEIYSPSTLDGSKTDLVIVPVNF